MKTIIVLPKNPNEQLIKDTMVEIMRAYDQYPDVITLLRRGPEGYIELLMRLDYSREDSKILANLLFLNQSYQCVESYVVSKRLLQIELKRQAENI